jgi:uncharacterized protein DUF4405
MANKMKRQSLRLIINVGLLFLSLILMLSGLTIQINYHWGNPGSIEAKEMVLGLVYSQWSDVHIMSSIFFAIFMIFHITMHWNWYKRVIKKKLFARNYQAIILSIVTIFVVLTGYIPLIINLSFGDEVTRKTFIEIHDKLALVFIVYQILHIAKRLKWYLISFRNL